MAYEECAGKISGKTVGVVYYTTGRMTTESVCDKVPYRRGKAEQKIPLLQIMLGQVCLAAKAADCKSVTSETPLVRVQPCPFMFACPRWLMVLPC